MRTRMLGLLTVALLAAPLAANALVWNWSYSGTLDTGAPMIGGGGTLVTGDPVSGSPNYFLITGIAGTYEGSLITALSSPESFGGNDNWLLDDGTQLDYLGMSFTANGVEHNFYWNPELGTYRDLNVADISFSASLASVPEPDTMALLSLGLVGVLLSRRRKVV